MLSGCGSAGQPKEMTIVVIQTLRVRAGICLVCCKSVVLSFSVFTLHASPVCRDKKYFEATELISIIFGSGGLH
jgi:hypothetical protein